MGHSPSSCMRTAVAPLQPRGDTETNKHPKPRPAARPKSGLLLGFSRERCSSCICEVLEATALSSVTGVGRKDVRQLACYLPDPVSQCLCFCERVEPDKAQGMHSPCIQVQGVFSFFFFFFLALSNVAMFDRSDLLSCNEPLGEKGQMQLPLATSLAAGR